VYSTQDTTLLEQIAGQVAVGLENLRLAQAQQRSLHELESLTRQLTGQAWAKQLQQLPGQEKYKQYTQSGIRPQLPTALPEVDLAMKTQRPVAWTQTDDQQVPSPYQATLATPIVLRGEVLGALQVGEMSEPRIWSDDDIAFIQSVADQVALALDNARLIEQTQRRAQREVQLNRIAQQLRQATGIKAILRTASEELSQALDTSHAQAQLGKPTSSSNKHL